jgi:hypothetical protein
MTDYKINATGATVAIQITGVGERQDELLQAFGECAEGRCSCPTDEYEKVAAMDVQPGQDRIDINLEAKPGTTLDTSEIEACLDYTVQRGH